MFFFTNNAAESMNSIFNSHIISNRKSFYSFRNCILETLDYFKNKGEYVEKGNQITKAIYLYVKDSYNQDRLPLLTHKDMSKIIDDYNKKKEEVFIEDEDPNSDVDYLLNNYEEEFSSSNYKSDDDLDD